jgi:hypothetical protein
MCQGNAAGRVGERFDPETDNLSNFAAHTIHASAQVSVSFIRFAEYFSLQRTLVNENSALQYSVTSPL